MYKSNQSAMKYLKQSVLFMLTLLLAVSCNDSDYERDPYPMLSLDKESIVVGGKEEKFTFSIASNKAWKASSNAEWCSLSESAGVGDGTIEVTIARNMMDDVREATILISAGIVVKKLYVVQEEGVFDGEPMLTPSVEEVLAYAAVPGNIQATFKVSSNIRWTLDLENKPEWIESFEPQTGAKGVTEVVISFNPNATGAYRSFILPISAVGAELETSVKVTQVSGLGQDSLAIRALYKALDGPNWVRKLSFEKPVTQWHSDLVFASVNGEQRLTQLKFNDNNMSGVVPEEIGALTELTYLGMNRKTSLPGIITGTLPGSIGNLKKLETFYIAYNGLTGDFPIGVTRLSKLNVLYINDNQLSGALPEEIGNLTEITNFRLQKNNFSGAIPETIGQLKKITTLYMNNNKLNVLPATMGDLKELKTLYINYNEFTGDVPEWIFNIYPKGASEIQTRVLNGNKFNPIN